MTASPAGAEPRTRPRRGARFEVVVVAVVMVGALVAWLLLPFLTAPPWRMVSWQLQGFPGRVSDTAASSSAIEVYVASWPTEYGQGDDSWLDQSVIETPWTVTIALHTSDAYESLPAMRSWYDTGGWVTVHLHAPLGGRTLFDGSGFPQQPRW